MTPGTNLVDGVREVTRPRAVARRGAGRAPAPVIRVRFASGVDAHLDPASPRDLAWAEVLESLRASRRPVYVEIDPETSRIRSLLLPRPFTVTAIRETPRADGLEVELEISHARHYLRRDHPRFDEMRRALEDARRARTTVLVTESLDTSAIVDVRTALPPRARRRR